MKQLPWHEGTLGFPPGQRFTGGILYQAGNATRFQLYESANAGKNPATLMGFLTTDIESDVADLKSHGVVFEDYDMDDIKTVDSIATIEGARAAWFKDPHGNIRGFLQTPS